MDKNENDTETEYALIKDPQNIHRKASNKTTLFSEIRNIINEQKCYNCTGTSEKTVSILSDEF